MAEYCAASEPPTHSEIEPDIENHRLSYINASVYDRAMAAKNRRRPKEALALLNQIMRSEPNPKVRFAIAHYLRELNRYTEAAAVYKPLLTLRDSNWAGVRAYATLNMAEISYATNDFRKADAFLNDAESLSDHSNRYLGLILGMRARLARASGDLSAAKEFVTKSVELLERYGYPYDIVKQRIEKLMTFELLQDNSQTAMEVDTLLEYSRKHAILSGVLFSIGRKSLYAIDAGDADTGLRLYRKALALAAQHGTADEYVTQLGDYGIALLGSVSSNRRVTLSLELYAWASSGVQPMALRFSSVI